MSKSESSSDSEETKRPKFSMANSYVEDIGKLVKNGPYSNRSEVVRIAITKLFQEHFEDGGPWFDSLVEQVVQINDKVCDIEEKVDQLLEHPPLHTQFEGEDLPPGGSDTTLDADLIDVEDDIYAFLEDSEPVTFGELNDEFDYTSMECHDALEELLREEYIDEIERGDEHEYKIHRNQ